MRINTWFTYDDSRYTYNPDPVSVTVPDLSYSIRDLLERFTTGTVPAEIVRSVMYTDNPDFDDFIETEYGDFDLTDCKRELEKLRELHSIRMERIKAAANEVKNSDNPPPANEKD